MEKLCAMCYNKYDTLLMNRRKGKGIDVYKRQLLRRTDEFDEEVSVYGVETDSAYVKLKDMDSLKDCLLYTSSWLCHGWSLLYDHRHRKRTVDFLDCPLGLVM